MTAETISGKCPCCGYDKMVMRYGSQGWYIFEGCPNCEFGYGSNNTDVECFGFDAWYDYALYWFVMNKMSEKEMSDDSGALYDKMFEEYKVLPHNELRKILFDFIDQHERHDDIENTIYVYTDEDIKKHKATNPLTFKNKIYGMFTPVQKILII